MHRADCAAAAHWHPLCAPCAASHPPRAESPDSRREGPGLRLTSLRVRRAAALGSGRVKGLQAHLRATAQATSAPPRRSIMMPLMFFHGIGLNVILRSSKPGIQGIYLFNDFDGC
jgi:hypothetical protein